MKERLSEQLKKYTNNDGLFFMGDKILVDKTTKNPFLPLQNTLDKLNFTILNALVDGSLIMVNGEIDLTEDELDKKNFSRYSVKKFLAESKPDDWSPILRAFHWINWDRQSKFCGRCGSVLEEKMDATEKKCPSCKTSIFPRFSPAVMVLIQNEDQILLARSPHFQPGYYSAIAGFIDIGETAEQAAHREVKEELGLEIRDLEYFSTQTWPFPDSFMIAFKAKYHGGELKLDEIEIEDARWFSPHELPQLPPYSSIARQLIESALAGMIKRE